MRDLILGDVFHPFECTVMQVAGQHLEEFIQHQEEVDPDGGQLDPESQDETHRDHPAPEGDGIDPEAEARVATGTEDAAEEGDIDGHADDVVGLDQDHGVQILRGLSGQLTDGYDEGTGQDHDQTTQHTEDKGQLQRFLRVFLALFQLGFLPMSCQ